MPADRADLSAFDSATLNQRVRREQLALLLRSSQSTILPAFIIAMLFWLAMYHQLSDPIVLVWGGVMHLNHAFRYLWVRRFLQKFETEQDRSTRVSLLVFLLSVNGAIWGLAALFFLPISNTLELSFVVVVILGHHSGGMSWMAPVKAAVISFSVPLMTLLTLALLLQEETVYRVGGVLVLVYAMVSLKYAMQHHKLLTDSLVARYEKAALAEQLAKQVELVERASDEKTRFLATASHDLRQPLHAMALIGAVLERELRDSPQHETASRLLSSVRLLGNSFDAMLDISRLDAGTVLATEAAVPLQPIFEAVNNMFSVLAGERGLELRVRPTPLWVRTDAELLQRMVANLVSNALKYTHKGGVLVVARQRKEAVWIDVKDTGLGIAQDQQTRIFDEFYQINNPGRDRALGLGIGLSIVKRLSHLLAHPIEVRTRLGRGSRFRLTLARARPQAPSPAGVARGKPALDMALPRRVLVLDDEHDVQYAMSALLKGHGIAVTCAGTEAQALAALQDPTLDPPHQVLLCDVRLANGEDGLAFAMGLNAVMAHSPNVILITGETAPASLQRLRGSGFDVLFKPVTADELLNALAQVGRRM